MSNALRLSFVCFCLSLISSSASLAAPGKGVALVYRGLGACEDGCWQAAVEVAQRVGLEVRLVGPQETDPTIFVGADAWIQPGGKSSTAAKAMSPLLKDNLRAFVSGGGGYVGYCAGGFLATKMISSRGVEGLGILPGMNLPFPEDRDIVQLPVYWNGALRDVYWEGGPYFLLEPSDKAEVTATYADGKIASLRAIYGKGRVYVTGTHPEATPDWREIEPPLVDVDGLDYDLSDGMLEWVLAGNRASDGTLQQPSRQP